MRMQRGGRIAVVMAAVVAVLDSVIVSSTHRASADATTCPAGTTMTFTAHQDDTILFLDPDLVHDIQAGRCIRSVFLTAGDSGLGTAYWTSGSDDDQRAAHRHVGEHQNLGHRTRRDPGLRVRLTQDAGARAGRTPDRLLAFWVD